jgi:hypothetical protein
VATTLGCLRQVNFDIGSFVNGITKEDKDGHVQSGLEMKVTNVSMMTRTLGISRYNDQVVRLEITFASSDKAS